MLTGFVITWRNDEAELIQRSFEPWMEKRPKHDDGKRVYRAIRTPGTNLDQHVNEGGKRYI